MKKIIIFVNLLCFNSFFISNQAQVGTALQRVSSLLNQLTNALRVHGPSIQQLKQQEAERNRQQQLKQEEERKRQEANIQSWGPRLAQQKREKEEADRIRKQEAQQALRDAQQERLRQEAVTKQKQEAEQQRKLQEGQLKQQQQEELERKHQAGKTAIEATAFKTLADMLQSIDDTLSLFGTGGYEFVAGFESKAIRDEKYRGQKLDIFSFTALASPHTVGTPNDYMHLKEFVEQLVQLYKIHLMPSDYDQLYAILQVIVQNRQEFQPIINNIKIKHDILQIYADAKNQQTLAPDVYIKDKLTQQGDTFPIIVIYPGSTKNNAQECLNLLCQYFGTMQGLNITPRYNKSVTSLIYYAQGDGDHKSDPSVIQYYTDLQQGNRAHYNIEQFKNTLKLRNITLDNLNQQDMELTIPDKCSRKQDDLAKQQKQPHMPTQTFTSVDALIKSIGGTRSTNYGLYDFVQGFGFSADRAALQMSANRDMILNIGSFRRSLWNAVSERQFQLLIDFTKTLVQLYKIHLMPTDSNQLYTILKTIFDNKQLFGPYIKDLKVKSNILDIYGEAQKQQNPKKYIMEKLKFNTDETLPVIVIYPSSTKNNAQECLNLLCQYFGTMQGLNITPRYNKSVTSLIYYAQGDGDDKERYKKYYTDDQQDNRAHYKIQELKSKLSEKIAEKKKAKQLDQKFPLNLNFTQKDMELTIPKNCAGKLGTQ